MLTNQWVGINRKTHLNQRQREQFTCHVCGDQLSSNAKLSYHITAKHGSSVAASSSSSSASSSSTMGKALKTPSPLPRAAASVPLASRPRVIARIVRQAKATSAPAAAAAIVSSGASTPTVLGSAAIADRPAVPSEYNSMLYVPPPMTPLIAAATAVSCVDMPSSPSLLSLSALAYEASQGSTEGKGELTVLPYDAAGGDVEIHVKSEPLSPHLSQASSSSSISMPSIDLRYIDDGEAGASVRRSTRLILQCREASCGAIFHSRPALIRHERTHVITGPFICGECKCECRTETDLRQHESDVHGNMASAEVIACGPFPCSSCGQIFKRRGNLLRHIKLQVCQPAVAVSVPQPRRVGSPIVATAIATAAPSISVKCDMVGAPAQEMVAEQPQQLLQGGFFPVALPAAALGDKDIQHEAATAPCHVISNECPLGYGDNGDSSPVHDDSNNGNSNGNGGMMEQPFIVDTSCLMSPLPSGMALHGSPIIPTVSIGTCGPVSTWSLDDTLLFNDIYTLDASAYHL